MNAFVRVLFVPLIFIKVDKPLIFNVLLLIFVELRFGIVAVVVFKVDVLIFVANKETTVEFVISAFVVSKEVIVEFVINVFAKVLFVLLRFVKLLNPLIFKVLLLIFVLTILGIVAELTDKLLVIKSELNVPFVRLRLVIVEFVDNKEVMVLFTLLIFVSVLLPELILVEFKEDTVALVITLLAKVLLPVTFNETSVNPLVKAKFVVVILDAYKLTAVVLVNRELLKVLF